MRRFSESRRPHPFSDELPVLECIRAERAMMSELRGAADLILDTSDWSIHDIRSLIYREFGRDAGHEPVMNVSLVSFGYKHGVPFGADLLFDVRFLPNPHFDPELRPLSGLDEPVRAVPAPADRFPRAGRAARRPAALPAAALSAGEPQLPDHRHRLHGRPASLGRLRRSARDRARRGQLDGAGEAPRPRESAPLTSVLLVTHGRLAQELLAAAETIAGVRPDIQALALEWNEGIDAARARIADAIAGLDRGAGRAHPHRHVRQHALERRHRAGGPGPDRGGHRRQPADGRPDELLLGASGDARRRRRAGWRRRGGAASAAESPPIPTRRRRRRRQGSAELWLSARSRS